MFFFRFLYITFFAYQILLSNKPYRNQNVRDMELKCIYLNIYLIKCLK